MRRSGLLPLMLLSFGLPAWSTDIDSIESCITAIEADPSRAREAAAVWHRLGGGADARTCEAFALEAMGARRVAAEMLTELAQDTNVALSFPERAILFDRATLQWQALEEWTPARGWTQPWAFMLKHRLPWKSWRPMIRPSRPRPWPCHSC